MRIIDLKQVYIYEPEKQLISGEYTTNWIFKGTEWLNSQQDINELDRNSAGEIDYEKIKLRTDRDLNISKGDGISFDKLQVDSKNKVIDDKPSYIVESMPTIGKTTVYSIITNNGE